MRRWLVAQSLRYCRWAASLSLLLEAQKALLDGRKPSTEAATNYAEFFQTPLSCDKGVRESVVDYFNDLQKQLSSEQVNVKVIEQERRMTREEDMAVFLLGYGFKKKLFYLYSVAQDKVVIERSLDTDHWDLADELMMYTKGISQFIVIPVVEAESERKLLQPLVAVFSDIVVRSGLQPATHVDTLELSQTFSKGVASLKTITVNSATGLAPEVLSDAWFRAHWVSLRTLACRALDNDPIKTINAAVLPHFDVLVVHLVKAGTRSMNISIFDPVRGRRYSAKGMLSDVIATLLSTRSSKCIFIPTNRTDRATLFRCRTALQKCGHQCVVVFPSEMHESYRQVFHSDPSSYWTALKEASHALNVDLLMQVYVVAGNTLRTYLKKRQQEDNSGTSDVGPLSGESKNGLLPASAEKNEEAAAIVSPSDAETWLQYFRHPKRQAAELAEQRHYRKYVAISYITTDHSDYGRPRNPLSPHNCILSTCMVDHQGNLLQPWAKYAGRGAYHLPSLAGFDTLVVHDAKHFLLHLWEDPELWRFIRAGGRVWCTMLAEYLLDAQRHRTGSNSVCEVALRYGVLLPAQAVLGNPNEGLPLAFHRRHLLKTAPAVATIFEDHIRRAVRQGQLISLAHRMDSLLAMASIERAGIFIDVEESERQSKALRSAALVLDHALEAFVPLEVPVDMREYFDWESVQHLRAYFFGGVISIGRGERARASKAWTANLTYLCHRYGAFSKFVAEVHLQRYATEHGLVASGGMKLPTRISQHLEKEGLHKRKKYRLVLFDIETTGLNITSDEIIEVAMFDPVENTSFASLVNPQRRISPRTVNIHHITDEAVKDAPSLSTVVKGLLQYLRLDSEGRDRDEILVLVGHNVFGIDEPMLRRAFAMHATEGVDFDDILFCDSLVLLKTLKARLKDSKLRNQRVDQALLDTLTSSLRLSRLIERLRIAPEGKLHRADTDTKALWFVLVNAFGLARQDPAKQRDAILSEAANTLLFYQAVGCFVPSERKRSSVQVRLPGVAPEVISNSSVLTQLKRRPFGDSVLASLHSHGVKVAGLLLQRVRLGSPTSSLLHADEGGRIATLHNDQAVHQFIDMTATTTSRTTSMYPSCQNIPKDDKTATRRLFVSRFGVEGRCVEVDYSQLEIVVLAILCQDAHLTRDLKKGVDFHVKRAEFFSGLPYKEIYEGYKRSVPKYVQLRKTAKQFSFQRLYGAGVSLLHKTTGIPVKDLEASIKAEDAEYPAIAKFHRIMRAVALRPNNPGLPTGFITEMPTGLRMSFKTRDVVLNLPPLKNYPIQGYGAELAQMMMARLFRHFVKKKFYRQRAFLTNFVHDSVWLDCHIDVLEECVRDTCRILSEVHTYVPQKFPGVKISVPLKVTAACGLDMCSLQNIHDDDYSLVYSQKKSQVEMRTLDVLPALTDSELIQEGVEC